MRALLNVALLSIQLTTCPCTMIGTCASARVQVRRAARCQRVVRARYAADPHCWAHQY